MHEDIGILNNNRVFQLGYRDKDTGVLYLGS